MLFIDYPFDLTFKWPWHSLEAPAYLIDLMHDKNSEIRKVCDNTLDMIAVSIVFRNFPLNLSSFFSIVCFLHHLIMPFKINFDIYG